MNRSCTIQPIQHKVLRCADATRLQIHSSCTVLSTVLTKNSRQHSTFTHRDGGEARAPKCTFVCTHIGTERSKSPQMHICVQLAWGRGRSKRPKMHICVQLTWGRKEARPPKCTFACNTHGDREEARAPNAHMCATHMGTGKKQEPQMHICVQFTPPECAEEALLAVHHDNINSLQAVKAGSIHMRSIHHATPKTSSKNDVSSCRGWECHSAQQQVAMPGYSAQSVHVARRSPTTELLLNSAVAT